MHRYAFDRSHRSIDADGRLHVADCNISKANVCPYYGYEIPNHRALGLDANRIYRLYRDPQELARAADSFAGLPLLVRHVPVTAEQPARDSWAGCVGTSISFDGTYLRADRLSVWSQEAIDLVTSGAQQELSPSYRYRADMTPGVHPEYGAYDGVMRDIIGNHVAMVPEGRTGPDVRIEDHLPVELSHMKRARRARLVQIAALAGITAPTEQQLIAMDAQIPRVAADECEAWDGWNDADRRRATDMWRGLNNVASDGQLTDDQSQQCWDWARVADPHLRPAQDSRPTPQPQPQPQPQLHALTQADLDRAVSAAERRASDSARRDMQAFMDARDVVRPVVGEPVACDSAEQVYRFALQQLGCRDHATIHTSALRTVFDAMALTRNAPQPRDTPRAHDAKSLGKLLVAIPGLQNLNVA